MKMLDTTEANEIRSGNLGTFLKNKRLAQGKTLNDADQATGITTKILQAIEDSDHSRLPNYIFVRGLVRIYSAFLKLDQHIILELFEKEWSNEIKMKPTYRLKESGIANRSYPVGCFTALILVILAIFVVILMTCRQCFIPSSINKHVIQEPANRYNMLSPPSNFANFSNQSTQRHPKR